jgi:PAS domain S-box-containing protein
LIADEVVPHRKAVVEELIRTGCPARFEDVRNGRHLHHSLYPILAADGSVLREAVYAMDITERRRSEEELRLSEKRYRYLFENVQDVVYTMTFDGTIIDITPSIKELSKGQYVREDLIGRSWADFYEHPKERQDVLDTLQKDGFINDYRIVLKNRDGSTEVCSISARLQYDDAGNPDRIIGNIRDVTDRVDLEKQLLQAQKMESVGRLAGGVAHDFNNMLGVIIGYTDLILEEVDEHQSIYPALKEIEQAALRSANLTGQLLAFARKQTVTPKVLDLHEAVVGMLTMLHRLIGEQIKLVWMPCPESLSVKMDPSQIDQILANLCVNARDAIRGNGTVIIETRREELDKTDTAGKPDVIPGPFACLAVTDDGCGIDPADLPHLFEPFYTTKEVGAGTGLGLATVYGIVTQNGGFVEVASQLGRGTTIEVYLPRVSELVPEQFPSHGEATAMQKGEETILLVEDEQMILEMTTRMLRHEGYRVIAAASPEQAVRIAAEHSQAIHLLITDVIMPSMNGKELAHRLHTIYPDLRCLFMSGYTADIIAQHGMLDTGISFIQKPFNRTELLVKVRAALDQPELG